MYISRIHIENLRCFRNARLDFLCPPVPTPPQEIAARFGIPLETPKTRVPNINLLLGDNGGGKSTVLRSIALGLLGPLMQSNSGWVPQHEIRHGGAQVSPTAQIISDCRLHEQDEPRVQNFPVWDALEKMTDGISRENFDTGITGLQISIKRRGDLEILESREFGSDRLNGLYNEESPAFFVLGYGATRRIEDRDDAGNQSKMSSLRYQRVAGLFSNHITLTPLSMWLPLVEEDLPERFEETRGLFNSLLPDKTQLISTKKGEVVYPQPKKKTEPYLFRFGHSEVPFAALSDGYRAYVGWIADMLYHLNMACPPKMKLTDCRGVVMIDEVDLHLHPSWQRVVVDTLSQTFPHLQFILTTHSPIVAGTLEPANIWVMETAEDKSVVPKRHQERIFGLNADQILTSSYFNLLTTRAPEAEKEIRTLAIDAANGDENASLEALRRLTGNIEGEELSDSEIVIP